MIDSIEKIFSYVTDSFNNVYLGIQHFFDKFEEHEVLRGYFLGISEVERNRKNLINEIMNDPQISLTQKEIEFNVDDAIEYLRQEYYERYDLTASSPDL